METLTLVMCLAVGITAVPIPEPQLLALPAAPVVLLSRPAPLRTNAVDSYVVIEEKSDKTPETEVYTVYSSTPTESSLYLGNDEEIGKQPETESNTVDSPAPTNEVPLQINNNVENEKDSESEVNTVSSPSSSEMSLPDTSSQEFAEPLKPAQPIEPADKPVPLEPETAPAAEESKPQGGKLETVSSSSGGIFRWLNPFHLPVPSIPTLSHIPFISNLPSLPSLPSVPSLQSVNIANLPSLSNLPSLPIQWPSWLPKPGGSSSSKSIAFRSPVYVIYS